MQAPFKSALVLITIFILILGACHKDPEILQQNISENQFTYDPRPYPLVLPAGFPAITMPEDNPLTIAGVNLGRKLFYDPILSRDSSISCASCHKQELAFTDGLAVSKGIDGQVGNRSSMSLVNLAWHKQGFFWDGRAQTLEQQVLEPVVNPIEMDESWSNVIQKLKRQNQYLNDFYSAFDTHDWDSTHAAKALAQFLRILISGNSKFDKAFNEDIHLSSFSQQEKLGYDIFMGIYDGNKDCVHCHLFGNKQFMDVNKPYRNNGLYVTHVDSGFGLVTGVPTDVGRFKMTTLRNMTVTAPYMHDGSIASLDSVILHYSQNIYENSPNLDNHFLINITPGEGQGGLGLTAFERNALSAFLKTLTDDEFLSNPEFSNPF